MKRRKTAPALILLLAAILILTGLSSCKDPEPEPLTDAEALRGQWAVYYWEEAKDGNQTDTETEVFAGIIDIQYTRPGYWLLCVVYDAEGPETIDKIYYIEDESGPDPAPGEYIGIYIETNRTQQEDGWFIVSMPPEEGKVTKIRYRFTDEERNIMEAEVIFPENEGSLKCIMKRLNHIIEILPRSGAENPEEGEGATTTTWFSR